MADRRHHDRAVALPGQAEDFVVLVVLKAFHRADVHAGQRGEAHELAQRDVGLAGAPFLDQRVARPLDHVALDDLRIALQVRALDAAHLGDA